MKNSTSDTTKIKVNSAYSAQPSIATPNPFARIAIDYIFGNKLLAKNAEDLKVADQGCGKLRHLGIFCQHFNIVYLVDLEFQLNRKQRLFGSETSVKEYISNSKMPGKKLIVLSSSDFDSSSLDLDIVFNICVFDVEVPQTRKAMASAAHRNLNEYGLYVLVVPRNDRSILIRCTAENKYLDGHIFQHHGVNTFYRNYSDTKILIQNLTKQGFVLEADLSRYRQVCLILRRRAKADVT